MMMGAFQEMRDRYAAALLQTPQLAREELAAWRARRREAALWGRAGTLADLGELVARFCEGDLAETPDHGGPRCPETVPVAAQLAHANRRGFVTTGSQPGYDRNGSQQRAAVEGWATQETAAQLEALVRGTRLRIQASERRSWRADYSRAFLVSRYVRPDGSVLEETHFGFVPGTCTEFVDLGRGDLTNGALYVTIHDPEWGDHSLLWDRLAQPDWNNPAPPPAAGLAPAPNSTTPSRTTTAPRGDTVSTSIEQVKALIAGAISDIGGAQSSIHHAITEMERARAAFMAAAEGSSQQDAEAAAGMLTAVIENLREALGQSTAAVETTEGVGARL